MKKLSLASLLLILFVCTQMISLAKVPPLHEPLPEGSRALAVFEGITPCDKSNPPLEQMSEDHDCELMIWNIAFFQDIDTQAPTSFHLYASYGMSQPNTTGIKNGGTQIDLRGTWSIDKGTPSNPEAIVYQIFPDNSKSSLAFVLLDVNLIHVLDSDNNMRVGNGGWSYTLNRTYGPQTKTAEEGTIIQASAPLSDKAEVSVYEGRTPCTKRLKAFAKLSQTSNCLKIKWRLTLYRDSDTGEATRYEFKGTEGTREGRWEVAQGTATYPEGLVYRIYLDDSDDYLAFFSADENHLLLLKDNLYPMIGNPLWSYTLSRVDKSLS